jgi:hypothetical protein
MEARGWVRAPFWAKYCTFVRANQGFPHIAATLGWGKSMSIRTAAVALLLLLAACEEPIESGAAPRGRKTPAASKAVTPAAPAAPPVVSGDVPKPAPAPDDRSAYSSCLLGCDDAKVAYADKAACRMNCERPASPAPGSGATTVVDSDPVEYVVTCMGRCYSDGKRSETCTSACKSAVTALPAAPSAGVLDSLGTCLDACHVGKHASETNRATCGLDCTQVARMAGPAPATAVKR